MRIPPGTSGIRRRSWKAQSSSDRAHVSWRDAEGQAPADAEVPRGDGLEGALCNRQAALLQRDAIAEWKERYAGASKLLGAYFDRSCTDPSRLFYTPRHPKGATNFRIEVVAGNALDLDKVERISAEDLRRESESPFEAAANAMGGGSAEYTTTGLKWFFAKYGDRFEVDEFLMEVDRRVTAGRVNGPGRTTDAPTMTRTRTPGIQMTRASSS